MNGQILSSLINMLLSDFTHLFTTYAKPKQTHKFPNFWNSISNRKSICNQMILHMCSDLYALWAIWFSEQRYIQSINWRFIVTWWADLNFFLLQCLSIQRIEISKRRTASICKPQANPHSLWFAFTMSVFEFNKQTILPERVDSHLIPYYFIKCMGIWCYYTRT